jgi:hypothetical protein
MTEAEFLAKNWLNISDEGYEFEGWSCISDQIVDTRRSSPVHQIVVKSPDEELWAFQVVEDEDEWWFYQDAVRVKAVEVTTTSYVPV